MFHTENGGGRSMSPGVSRWAQTLSEWRVGEIFCMDSLELTEKGFFKSRHFQVQVKYWHKHWSFQSQPAIGSDVKRKSGIKKSEQVEILQSFLVLMYMCLL